jgi:hypothetical protein
MSAEMNKDLKGPLPDNSPGQSYTRDITIEEIEAMKRHIKAHGIDTAMGVDGFSYRDYRYPEREITGILPILFAESGDASFLANNSVDWTPEEG